eukprot:SAG11_NODE_528_length_8722_cov_5.291198_10_plen_33_part_00
MVAHFFDVCDLSGDSTDVVILLVQQFERYVVY